MPSFYASFYVSINWIGGATMTGASRWRRDYGVWPDTDLE